MEPHTPEDSGGCGPVLSRAMRACLFTFKPVSVVDERASTATPFVASAAAAEAQREQQEVVRGETAARQALFDLLVSANRAAVECAAAAVQRGPVDSSSDEEEEEEEEEEEVRDRGRGRCAPRRGAAGGARDEGFVAERECDAVDNNAEYRWRKYGEKPSVSKCKKRCYYKCVCPGCPARKIVVKDIVSAHVLNVEERDQHNHPPGWFGAQYRIKDEEPRGTKSRTTAKRRRDADTPLDPWSVPGTSAQPQPQQQQQQALPGTHRGRPAQAQTTASQHIPHHMLMDLLHSAQPPAAEDPRPPAPVKNEPLPVAVPLPAAFLPAPPPQAPPPQALPPQAPPPQASLQLSMPVTVPVAGQGQTAPEGGGRRGPRRHRSMRLEADGYNWRKYGEKALGGSGPHVRKHYFRCTHEGCAARKFALWDDSLQRVTITYSGTHCHAPADHSAAVAHSIRAGVLAHTGTPTSASAAAAAAAAAATLAAAAAGAGPPPHRGGAPPSTNLSFLYQAPTTKHG